MKRSIVYAVSEFLPLVGLTQLAEEQGFDRVWTTESPNRDALVRALALGLSTTTIGVASGIAYAFTRSPLALAATASDISTATNGRFSLGLGAGTQGMRTRWYGVSDFDHAASRIEEYADLMREAWRSTRKFDFEGRFYTGSYGELEGERPVVPIWGSGVNETMLRLSARSCDGVAVHALGAEMKNLDRRVLPAIRAGAEEAGRSPEVALWRITAVNDDANSAREMARRGLAFYFSTPSYGAAAEAADWGNVAETVRNLYRDHGPDWNLISAAIPDEMVADFCWAGSPDEVRGAFTSLEAEYQSRGVTEIVFQAAPSLGSSEETLGNIEAIIRELSPTRGG